MAEFFAGLGNVAIVVFAATSMVSVGLGHRFREIIEPLRRPRKVARALVANFVLVPALALFTIQVIPLDRPLEAGLILISAAAGAPFLIKLSEIAGSPLGLAATLLVLLLPVTIVYLPVMVPLLLPGTGVSVRAVATPLLVTMLLPLAAGLLARERWAGPARRVQPVMSKLATVALVVVILSMVLAHFDAILGIGWRAALATLVVVVGAFLLGYLIAGRDPDDREVLGLGTGQRNIAAASVVASQSLGDPDTVIMVIAVSLIGLALLFPIAQVLRRRELTRHGRR